MFSTPPRAKNTSSTEGAFALIIVLAFIVLLTGLAITYYSRTTADRQIAHSSFNQSKVDQLAASAMDNIIGDVRQELLNGSSPSPAPNPTPVGFVFTPTSSANILPRRSPTPAPANTPAIPNLIRRSARSEPAKWPDPATGPALGSRASAVNSTIDVSANGRSISLARWNSHYLVRKANPGDDKSDPVIIGFTAPNYWAPDWVFVTNQGANIIGTPSNAVVGRYAYALYDEGGLVDVNVAGYPSGTSVYQYGRKGSLAFADLTAPLPYAMPNGPTSTPAASPTPAYQVDRIVGWRNYGTAQPNGTFPDSTFATNFQPTNTAAAAYFYNFVVNNTSGFLNVRSDPSPTPYPWNYLQITGNPTPSPYPWNGRTDQMFLGRQQLLAFRNTTQFSSNALEYLGTFSREAAAGAPQWTGPSPTPTAANPNFQTLLVTSSFPRNDGTTASVGDPLVNKRFLLQRLNWLTYRGPSATTPGGTRNAVPTATPATGTVDYDLWLLTSRFGLTSKVLQDQVLGGTAANILKYFGLAWDATNERWNYAGHSGGTSPVSSIATLGSLTGTRDPDFFELLQAGILDNSLGLASSPDSAMPIVHQQSKTLQILTIGANIIAQSRADSYPVRIAFNNGATIMEAVGCPRLPFLNSLSACAVAGTAGKGGVNWLLVPNLWDPFRDSWDLTENYLSSTLTPGYLRPPVRIRANGTAAFGAVVAAPSPVASPTPAVSPFPGASVNVANLSLTLKTNSPGIGVSPAPAPVGRDAFTEASRIGTSDVTPTPTPFTTTTSASPTPVAMWNNVSRPPRTNGTVQGNDNVIVLRLSLPGSSIPVTATTPPQNPVLILNSGFQVTMEYQSPNGTWYSYSNLQGNNASTTWISANLNLASGFSKYAVNPAPSPSPAPLPVLPTVVNVTTGVATAWDMTTLSQAPMFAKADPRSIRYNSQIGVVSVPLPNPAPTAAPVPTPWSAGVIGSIWPNGYATPPPMWTTTSPGPTPNPNPNPAMYSQIGDNGPATSNPYSEATPGTLTAGDPVRPVIMNRPFRSVGEMGYAFRDEPFKTLDFSSANSPDAGLLDLFSVNDYGDPSSMRAGVISINSGEATALAAALGSTIKREDTSRVTASSVPSPIPQTLSIAEANNTAIGISTNTVPATNKAGLAALIGNATAASASPSPSLLDTAVPKTQRESIARAFGEADQTRTWNLMIDVIAQSGRYPPNAASGPNTTNPLANFVVDGEQRYWVHVAIDRFTGQVIDKQIEVVNE